MVGGIMPFFLFASSVFMFCFARLLALADRILNSGERDGGAAADGVRGAPGVPRSAEGCA